MATPSKNPWRASIGMSSDHAGIARELDRLQVELYRVLSKLDDPRYVRDYIRIMIRESTLWLMAHPMLAARK
jgi:hypothetical protein